MNFELDADQQALRQALENFVRTGYLQERRRDNMALELGERSPSWQDFADIGLLGLLVPETYGGSSRTMVDAGLVMEQFGRALVVEPFVASAVVATSCILHADGEALKERLLPALARGDIAAVVVSTALHGAPTDASSAFRAKRRPDGWLVTGRHDTTAGADGSDLLVLDASNTDVAGERVLLLVERDAPGVHIAGYRNHDGTRGAALTLDSVTVPTHQVLAQGDLARDLVARAHGNGIAAICSEAVGAMSAVFELTLDYLRARKQFGVALSSFQAIRHRAVDMLLALERARSMALLAGIAADDPLSKTRSCRLSAAKVQICQSARFVGQQAIQLHGGMGMTDEYVAGHYFRRLTAIEHAFGGLEHHLDVLSDAGGVSGIA